MSKTLPFGTWPSAITTNLMVSSNIGLAEARLDGNDLYWLEFRPRENGRNVIVRHDEQGTRDLIGGDYNCRSQVHEYGGASYMPTPVGVFFVNQADQQIYRATPDGQVARITDASETRFADLCWCNQPQRLLAIAERHDATRSEPENQLVSISLIDGTVTTLHSGHDFYASATFSPDGGRLAWLTWDHPAMPWDGTSLWVADVQADDTLSGATIMAGGEAESIFQPEWSPGGSLFFVSDQSNWWNLYQLTDTGPRAVCPMESEFGRPQWVFGMTTYGFLSDDQIITSYSVEGSSRLAIVNLATGALTDLPRSHSSYDSLRTSNGKVCYLAQSPVAFPALYLCDNATDSEQLVRAASSINLNPAHYSRGQSISYPTGGGATAHAFFYPPAHPECEAPAGEKPPVIVMIHGGPTSATADDLSLKVQYWTSRGFAVLDVNYRGSTGFGRRYRDALKQQWGVADVEDCDFGVRYLAAQGLIDADKAAIRGGSAGGYTTLAALALTDTFKAGASLYGVSDLTALATDTHKFESRYLDSLIGPYPEQKALYEQRSPINHANKITCPVIFLQGLEDKIVPPNQAEMMIEALAANDVAVAYLPFEGEQHGFRRSETIVRAFEAELWFYGQIFGFDPADDIEPVEFVSRR